MRRATAPAFVVALVSIATACGPASSPAPSATNSAGETSPASGRYGPGSLDLVFDPDSRTVSGFYENHTGSRFSCEFFLEGKRDGTAAEIQTWYPGSENRIRGLLRVPEEDRLEILLDDEHGGCANVEPRFDEGGVSFRLEAARPGKAIAVVAGKKAFFHDQPVEESRRDSYTVQGDAVYVLEAAPGWVKVAFRDTKGWLRASDFFADTLPE